MSSTPNLDQLVSAYHPLYAEAIATEGTWQRHIQARARQLRCDPSEVRYGPEGEKLPSYEAFRTARAAWMAAGRPVYSDPAPNAT